MSIAPPDAEMIDVTDTSGRQRTGMTVWPAIISVRSAVIVLDASGPPVYRSRQDSIVAM